MIYGNRLSNKADKILSSGFYRRFSQASKVWGSRFSFYQSKGTPLLTALRTAAEA